MKTIVILVMVLALVCGQYTKKYTYKGQDLLDKFRCANESWSQLGFSDFVSCSEATSAGLLKVTSDKKVYLGSDYTTILPSDSSSGRRSVRIESKKSFNSGLFIVSFSHVPTGRGTWPAFWTFGPSWPNTGEIDAYEVPSHIKKNHVTLHTSEGCVMPKSDQSTKFTGTWSPNMYNNGSGTNCWINAPDQWSNQGYGIENVDGTAHEGVNAAGGTYIVIEWVRTSYIKVWQFLKGSAPSNIAYDTIADPSAWGLPTAHFTLGANCPAEKFKNNVLTFNIAYCGWASQAFSSDAACKDYVRNNPGNYSNAYFTIDWIKYLCKANDTNCTTTF